MIYPKNKSSASQSKQRSKKSFLNPYQREELKKRLIEKFTKLYGLNNPSVIKEEVTSFFKTNNEINADNLRILEQNVRVACLQKKSIAKTPAQLPNGQHVSNAHGSNGAGPSIVTHKNRAPSSNGSNRHKLPPVNSEMLDSRNLGVENLTEEDQWNAINKYNTYLFKQEQKLQRMKELEKRRKMQEQLDSQMKEKERRKNLEKAAKQDYVNAENELYNYECQQDVRRKELQKEKVIFEKEMRDLQMREIEERKRFEYEQEKTLDTYILNKTKAEIEEEHAEQIRKRQEKMDIMRKMMEENNERKRILLEQKEKEKQEDVELNKKAILLAEELEKQRELELKLRNDRIAKLIQNSEAKVKEIENKNYDMEMKNRRYQELREKAMKEKEARDNYMAQRRKEQLKTFLDRQVDAKKNREVDEHARNAEQALIWKQEQEQYTQFAKDKDSKHAARMQEYKTQLQQQMAEREANEKKKRMMTTEEAALNKLLLEKVGSLHVDDSYLQHEAQQKKTPVTLNNIY